LAKMGAHRRLPVIDVPPGDGVGGDVAKPKRREPPRRRIAGPDALGSRHVEAIRYRFKFEKTGPSALLGHLDLVRALPRIMRGVGAPLAYSLGFHPKPEMNFSPALALGVPSLGEYCDIKSDISFDPSALLEEMSAAAGDGLCFVAGARLSANDSGITKVLS